MSGDTHDLRVLELLRAWKPTADKDFAEKLPQMVPLAGAQDELRRAIASHPKMGTGRFSNYTDIQLPLDPITLVGLKLGDVLASRSPEETLAWLLKIYAVKEADLYACSELMGVRVENRIEFSNGVTIVPWDGMPDSWMKDSIGDEYALQSFVSHRAFRSPVGAFLLIPQVPGSAKSKSLADPFGPIDDVLLGLTIATDQAPVSYVTWTQFRDRDLQEAVLGLMYRAQRFDGLPPGRVVPIPVTEADVAFVEKYLNLPANVRRPCAVAAFRLNLARRRASAGDRAIEAATSLEALLATEGERSEMTYRFRLRAALLLESGIADRRRVSKATAELLRLRGKVVHGASEGTTSADNRIAADGIALCMHLLRLVVDRGALPDLSEVELSGGWFLS